MPYEPIDNASDVDEFEAVEPEFMDCPNCDGCGWANNGIIAFRCRRCRGTGEIVKEG